MASRRWRVGSELAFVAQFLGRRLEYTYVVRELVPGERLVMSTEQGPFPMETTYEFADAGEGATRMTLRNRGEPCGLQADGGSDDGAGDAAGERAEVADEVRARSVAKPFGSVAARVTLGEVAWETSLFADSKSASYLLPLKADVRRRTRIEAGDTVTLTIALADPAA